MKEHERRRELTANKITALTELLKDAQVLMSDSACVYATGSYGRLEASEFSDLDLFIVGRSKSTDSKEKGYFESQLTRLNEICIKADLIEATRTLKIQEFDGDGRYLAHYSVGELVGTLGTPEDDATNTFTARLLMLLEGRPILGDSVFASAIEEIIAAYWGDYEDHKGDFVPAYFANDVLRLWRTFCVNYEARTRNVPHELNLKRRLKNYKLKHSRLLTCYSALLVISHNFSMHGTITPQQMYDVVSLTPMERVQALLDDSSAFSSSEGVEPVHSLS